MLTLTDASQAVVWSSADKQVGSVLSKEDISDALIINDGDRIAGYLVVENGAQVSVDEITPFVSRLREVLFYAGGLAVLLAIGLAIILSNYLLKPVKALTEASTELSSGIFSTRVDVTGNDEIAVLGRTFNKMAGNLELAEERKKSLTADVAHELRTPIAVQKAQLEGMIDGVLPVSEENLAIALQQTDFLSRMVDDLRLLAMADADEVKFEFMKIDLRQLVGKISAQFQAQLQLLGTQLTTVFIPEEGEIFIETDPNRLTQILQNLVSNAIRYGKKGGCISVTTQARKNRVAISVRDDGSGIPAAALPHIFERFYRHERARSRETGGTGLGLAISKKLSLLMGGDLYGENAPDGGAVFTLELPYHKT
jgi:signal transduction histidine kinase